jgi:CDP-diacylglycerol---glycerol-3-phosphate 3-phosphatidyltransferase
LPLSLYDLKPRFQALLRPAVRWLAARDVTANQVTLAAAIGSVAVGAVVVVLGRHGTPFLLVPIWLFVRMALNAIDGMLAREHGQQSRVGAYLNELCDVVSDVALYAPFALVAPFKPSHVGLVLFLIVLTEFAGTLGPMVGASRRYEGPLGKSDRALLFGALAVWIGIGVKRPAWLAYVMPVIAILLLVTVVNRVKAGLAEAAAKPPS